MKFETPEDFVLDTVRYYSEDTNRRCVVASCYYDPAKADKEGISEGCAIGRHMTETQKATADEKKARRNGYDANTVDNLKPEYIPESLQQFDIKLLRRVQLLHDGAENWNDFGLTYVGKSALRGIIDEFKLDPTPFEAYL